MKKFRSTSNKKEKSTSRQTALFVIAAFFSIMISPLVLAQDVKDIPVAPPRRVVPDQKENVGLTEQELTNKNASMLQATAAGARIEGEVEHVSEPLNILFLLDCSLSMKEKMKDQTQKIEAAKQVLQRALARIPTDVSTGLRVFGQGNARSNFGIFSNDCEQTALLVPIGQGNRRAIIEQIRSIRAFGMTPLTYALEQCARSDFANASGKKVIILISDGADTCGGDPCRLISMLPAYGIKIKIDVVGLDLKKDRVARSQLNCITETSGGKYYDANSADEFINGVTESVNTAISGRVLPKAGSGGTNSVEDVNKYLR